MSDTPVLELRGVTKRYGAVLAVADVNLAVPHGAFYSLLGPSGCGKTTTLRLIAGFEEPTAGGIFIRGDDIKDRPPYRRPVNTVFQSYALFPHMDVFENVAFGLRRQGIRSDEIRPRVGEALEMVKLSGLEKRRANQLSGGQQQRVALARALVNKPAVLLLDEPMAALDLKLRKAMQGELKRLQRESGITFILVTHDQEEAMAMSDYIAVMNEARVEQNGPPADIYERPASRFVADFIGMANFLEGEVVEPGRVRLASGLAVRIADRSLAPAHRVTMVLRPEKLHLGEPATDNVFDATVTDVVYLGSHTQVHLDLSGIRMTAVTTAPFQPHPGDPCRLSWAAEAATLLPLEG
ncbi:MAG: ABC transporter ATP-binding protein [Candidatus Xenobia bacterium]